MAFLNRLCIAIFAIVMMALVSACSWKESDTQKINGVSLVAPSQHIPQSELHPLLDINANWVAITPYAFSSGNSPQVSFGHNHQWWGEGKEGTIKQIEYAHNLGINVMLKPHIWVKGQGWAGDYELKTDKEWNEWGESYAKYILANAAIAESKKVKMLCIGTEYRKSVTARPDLWRHLIREVRKVYKGKVVYAANWDNYQNVSFWDDLDYIGIDAYFPISELKSPELKELKEGWQSTKNEIEAYAISNKKHVIFTEFGYQSIDFSNDGHWKHNQDTLEVNLENQATAYQAVFDTFWKESWFRGGFLWKWHTNHPSIGGTSNKSFTPQNKPAQKTITDWYGRH